MPANGCDYFRTQMAFFLDGELEHREREDLKAHLSSCEACREYFQQEEEFRLSIREAAPLNETPAELRSRLATILAEESRSWPSRRLVKPSSRLRRRIARTIAGTIDWPSGAFGVSGRGKRWIASGLVIASLAAFVYFALDRKRRSIAPPPDFARLAVDSHMSGGFEGNYRLRSLPILRRRYLNGLPARSASLSSFRTTRNRQVRSAYTSLKEPGWLLFKMTMLLVSPIECVNVRSRWSSHRTNRPCLLEVSKSHSRVSTFITIRLRD